MADNEKEILGLLKGVQFNEEKPKEGSQQYHQSLTFPSVRTPAEIARVQSYIMDGLEMTRVKPASSLITNKRTSRGIHGKESVMPPMLNIGIDSSDKVEADKYFEKLSTKIPVDPVVAPNRTAPAPGR